MIHVKKTPRGVHIRRKSRLNHHMISRRHTSHDIHLISTWTGRPYTINPRETIHVVYTWKCTPIIHMRNATWITREKHKAQTSLDIHHIYTWIGTSINHVKNTRGKHVKQKRVAFFTWYPSDIQVNRYTINPRVTIHVEYTWKCTPIIHMGNATWTTREKNKAQTRFFIKLDPDSLLRDLDTVPWHTIEAMDNVDDSYGTYGKNPIS